MADSRPVFHFYDDFSLTPAYAMGYAFHALGRIDPRTHIRGPRGALALLNEFLATLTSLELDASLLAAEPLRLQQQAMLSRSRSSRLGPVSASEITGALATVELCVREELRVRASTADPKRRTTSPSPVAPHIEGSLFERCPEALRSELIDACRALDARLYTASVFHLHRVWEQLPGRTALAVTCGEPSVADPRVLPTLRCSEDDAARVFVAVRCRLEDLYRLPDVLPWTVRPPGSSAS